MKAIDWIILVTAVIGISAAAYAAAHEPDDCYRLVREMRDRLVAPSTER